MDDIYPVSEDTLLILRNLQCGNDVLEMGTGNGEIAIYCAKKGKNVTAVDIDISAINYVKNRARNDNLSIKLINSDLFKRISGKYDTIIFNPPYLPGDAKNIKDLQWAGGGKYGDLIIIRFLKNVNNHLKENGEIYLIISSFNRLDKIKKFQFDFELLDELKLSFHKIYLYKLKRKNK